MTNVDDMLKKMLGKAKGKSVSKPISRPLSMGMPKMVMPQAMLQRKGASIPMQKQWKSFSKQKQMQMRRRFKDSDRDGVPNRWDCQPHNKFKQDTKKIFDINIIGCDDIEVLNMLRRDNNIIIIDKKYLPHGDSLYSGGETIITVRTEVTNQTLNDVENYLNSDKAEGMILER